MVLPLIRLERKNIFNLFSSELNFDVTSARKMNLILWLINVIIPNARTLILKIPEAIEKKPYGIGVAAATDKTHISHLSKRVEIFK